MHKLYNATHYLINYNPNANLEDWKCQSSLGICQTMWDDCWKITDRITSWRNCRIQSWKCINDLSRSISSRQKQVILFKYIHKAKLFQAVTFFNDPIPSLGNFVNEISCKSKKLQPPNFYISFQGISSWFSCSYSALVHTFWYENCRIILQYER